MISPEVLEEKANRLYQKAVEAWLHSDTEFFPYAFRVDTTIPADQSEAIRQIEALKLASKEVMRKGYTIHWQQSRLRKHGTQKYPAKFTVESLDDLLGWIGKKDEFRRLQQAIGKIRQDSPQLEAWCIRNWKKVIEIESELGELLQVVNHLAKHPRPNCFPRELPLSISTKLIETHQAMLAEWFDIALPDGAIQHEFGRYQFARRYGFRQAEPHFLIRLLDPELEVEFPFPCTELSLPLGVLEHLRVERARVVLVENRTNLLTLPEVPRGIALGGLGYGVTQFASIGWLATNELFYWGDLDVDGFRILSLLREHFPCAQSMLMDNNALKKYGCFAIEGNGAAIELPANLRAEEAEAFRLCSRENVRIEQERIPQVDVIGLFQRFSGHESINREPVV